MQGTTSRHKVARRHKSLLRCFLVLLTLSLVATAGFADYVGSLTNRIFLDPATIPAIIDGYQNGDEIAYILETTPRDTGSTNGVAAWMTLYVPDGVEVIGASFVTQAGDGSWVDIPAEDGDTCWLDCGQRNCNRFDLVSGSLRLDDGAISEVNHDSGIFYSTDPRTAVSLSLLVPSIEVTGAQTKPADIFNQWDYDQCKAFGMKKLGGVNAAALSGNSGKGNTPLISLDSGTTWAGTGSMVAGPDTFYTNDYNPACDCNGGCIGSSDFEDDVQCIGPWNRIAYPNSKLADSGSVTPSTTASAGDGNTSVVTGSGVTLSSASPLPAGTNAIRWVHGKRTLGDIEHGRVAFRITDVTAFLASFTDDTFCLESTGGDTSDVRGKDNAWRYYEPEHKCFDDLGGPGADAVLLKQVLFVNGNPSGGEFLTAGAVISWQVTFTNTSGGTLTNVMLEDTPDTNVSLVEPGSEVLCAYSSYDGDLPGPAYTVGSITGTGTATWAAIPSLAAQASVTVSLCGKVNGAVTEGAVVKNTAMVTYTLPDPSVEVQTSSTTGVVANCIVDSDCDDADLCTGTETCVSGECQPGTPLECDDFNLCTTDSCVPITGCVNLAKDCSDGVSCTADTCDPGSGQCQNTPSDSLCSNGDFCDGAETCDAVNGCQAGTAPNCNDGVSCTADSCDEANDQCVNAPMDSLCSNGQFCDGVEACDPVNDCQAGTPPNCADSIGCTDDSCDEVNDKCVNAPNDGLCSNGNACDGIETCDPVNDCQAGAPPNCDDGNPCTVDSCDPLTGSCSHTPKDALCDNGVFCDGVETCDAVNGCVSGDPVDCNDNVTCTVDACNELNDVCVHTPQDSVCDNGQYCDGVETCDAVNGCQAGTAVNCGDTIGCTVDSCDEVNDVCVHAPNDGLCNDGQHCNGVETCDAVNDCQAGTPPDCSDSVACTVDSCDEVNDQCVHTPDDVVCNDLVSCTSDVCDPVNGCQNTAEDALCDNGMHCDGIETCDPLNDCQNGTPPNCDDMVACTDDSCDEVNDVCVNTPNNANCDDGAFCNGPETCDPVNGCQPGSDPCPKNLLCDEANDACVECLGDDDCDDGAFCNGFESCVSGSCTPGTPPVCNDGIACTVDTCDPQINFCRFTPSDALCDNGLYCDGDETCDPVGGCQAGTAPNCDDGVACTVDACDEVNDQCTSTPDDNACADGVPCTVDTCDPVNGCGNTADDALCDNGLFCDGTETCDPLLDCRNGTEPCVAPLKCDEVNDLCVDCLMDSQCDDGLYCNGMETCVGGSCVPGTPPNCNDTVSCTLDSCDEVNDVCVHTPDDGLCGNGQFCDGTETCDAVNDCQSGTPPDCGDTVLCTVDTCDEVNDVCVHTPDDGLCSNSLFCDGTETCDPLNGCQNGTPPNCDDGVPCTDDTCDEVNDVCDNTPNNANCDDGAFCNGAETCDPLNDCQPGSDPCPKDLLCDEVNDACVECLSEDDCDDGAFCNGFEECVSGVCQNGPPPDCDDGNACTVDICDPQINFCRNTPDDALCDDGLFCNGVETCDPVGGCQAGTPPNCGDTVSCTVDSCDEVNDVCVNAPDDGLCDNGLFCDGAETCDPLNGCQNGTPPNCGDLVACTVDACDEVNDTCTHTPNDGLCTNGQFCDGDETCDPVNDCQSGTPPDCNDNVVCTTDACDEVNDVCTNDPKNSQCDDGLHCNGIETCDPLNDCQPGTPPDCDDGVVCTADACDEVNDLCTHTADDGLCDNGLFCDGTESCDPANDCQPGTPPDCGDNVVCTVDACDEVNDTCTNTPDDSVCDDTQFCNGVETCDPVIGCQAGTPVDCSDSVPCTIDTCDELNDICRHMADDSACNDGDPCTVDVCDVANGCVHTKICGACCQRGGGCIELMTPAECDATGLGIFLGVGTNCIGDGDGDGFDDACPPLIPTVSEWGLLMMALLLLVGAKLYFGRRHAAPA